MNVETEGILKWLREKTMTKKTAKNAPAKKAPAKKAAKKAMVKSPAKKAAKEDSAERDGEMEVRHTDRRRLHAIPIEVSSKEELLLLARGTSLGKEDKTRFGSQPGLSCG